MVLFRLKTMEVSNEKFVPMSRAQLLIRHDFSASGEPSTRRAQTRRRSFIKSDTKNSLPAVSSGANLLANQHCEDVVWLHCTGKQKSNHHGKHRPSLSLSAIGVASSLDALQVVIAKEERVRCVQQVLLN